MKLLDGKELSLKIKESLKLDVGKLNTTPRLAIVMVGNNKASTIYVNNKKKMCDELGISYEEHLLDENTSEAELIKLVEKLNNKKDIHGIITQSPMPKHINEINIFNKISPNKDVDGLSSSSTSKLYLGQDTFIPCTVLGIIEILKEYKIPVEGKNVVILGRSNIVGKPLALALLNLNATVTVCHSKTNNIKDITKTADILISAIGNPKYVTVDMVKEGVVVIDAGINRLDDGKVVGDVDFDNVSSKCSYITRVPGGVGPMTIIMLMHNLIKATKKPGV